jgi:hypothetical protein
MQDDSNDAVAGVGEGYNVDKLNQADEALLHPPQEQAPAQIEAPQRNPSEENPHESEVFVLSEKTRWTLTKHLANPYNKFCVDCHHNESSMASVSFGIFLCEECGQEHQKSLGMELSYVKDVFQEHWDPFQLKMLDESYGGGNHVWFELIKEYGLQGMSLKEKYRSPIAIYRKKVLFMRAEGNKDDIPLPPKDFKDRI